MIRKLFSHTIIYGAAPHVSKVASFFVLPIVTQYLTAVDYGIYGVVTATTGLISVLANLGLRVVLVNSYYKHPHRYKWAWRQIYGFLRVWLFPFAACSSLLVYLIIPKEAGDNIPIIIALNVLPGLLFGQTATIATTLYQVQKKPIPIAMRTAIFGTLTVLLNLYTIAILKMGYMGWFWSSFIVTILNNASYWFPLNRKFGVTPIFNFKRRFIKRSLKISLPTIPHYYATYLLNTSDRLVMQFVNVSTANIGKYNAAYTFGNYFSNLGIASGLAVGPILNECYQRKDDRTARNLIFLQQTVFLLLSVAVSLWLKELFEFFIRNDELNQTYGLGVIIVMAYNYRPMYYGANAKIFFEEKTNVLWRVSFVAGALNVVLNLIFIPIFGYPVAAITTFVCLMYMGYSGYYLKAFRDHNTLNYYPELWMGLTIALTVAVYFMVEMPLIYKVVTTLLLVPVGAVGMLRLRKKIHEKKSKKTSGPREPDIME
jgi:O-antigen/teichoic acid export membrane protein